MPSLAGIYYICDFLGISVSEFFEFDNRHPTRLNDIICDLKRMDDKQLNAVAMIIKEIIRE